MSPIPPYPQAASSAPATQGLMEVADVAFQPDNGDFQAGVSGDVYNLLAAPLEVTVTNPSATQQMRVLAQAFLPNLNLSTRDAGGAPTHEPFSFTRIAQLVPTPGTTDVTEADADPSGVTVAPDGVYIAPGLRPAVPVTLAAGASVTFAVTDIFIPTFDDVTIDHLRVGTQEQGYPNRARLVAHGHLIPAA